ncbi:hypothetical protein CVV65_06485 [Kyrpidia spormannii]|uniref:Uncharacterized protein n=2 Tax=Kyrpidia spormannii TaxID=2055160 RepID=A0A2K8N6C2_9BACL|nr:MULTISPECIES: hypothetical protein [Kyrpidia]HHY66699.1 hypothetical protein [Alicyclobacillus sp.]ATY84635.1 hypothetical protein CVV65_06485 [Kyrpidia spormannii]MCL6576248.1 hypothetical protein [Kyrpidia sp.]CAB3391492.1 conserved protein of unknown function [Kyrpidia spormannii]CAB3392405.1 conserved protein of unknown function [Kyrpidia spormannii]
MLQERVKDPRCVRVSIRLGDGHVPWIRLNERRFELPFGSIRLVARLVGVNLRNNPDLREVEVGNPHGLRGKADIGSVIEALREVILASGRSMEFSAMLGV